VVRDRGLDRELRIAHWPISPQQLADLVKLVENGTISGKIAKMAFEALLDSNTTAEELIQARGWVQISDDEPIREAVTAVLNENPDKVAEYRAGKTKLLGFFVGQIMRRTGGRANPQRVNEILSAALEGRSS
jgi:aspartyl-tRNA(Asn)/glutamyl-tRNA(Gln) amidotransferase subunit B